jgi:hypothetical protein
MKTLEEMRRALDEVRRTVREQRARLRAAHEAACERGGFIAVNPARLAELEDTCAPRPLHRPEAAPNGAEAARWIRC